jgi:hypothetical protein
MCACAAAPIPATQPVTQADNIDWDAVFKAFADKRADLKWRYDNGHRHEPWEQALKNTVFAGQWLEEFACKNGRDAMIEFQQAMPRKDYKGAPHPLADKVMRLQGSSDRLHYLAPRAPGRDLWSAGQLVNCQVGDVPVVWVPLAAKGEELSKEQYTVTATLKLSAGALLDLKAMPTLKERENWWEGNAAYAW